MTNALAGAKSPYLRAHALNPVDWYPWGEQALELARREQRPLFVSVGYFACHWCHVMAREAFSDAAIAKLLNAHFVSIKVDREERPDIDHVLQIAHQALTGGGGGWPLSVFLEPESLTPFFTGTYFPLAPRYGMPGFGTVLERVIAAWTEHRADLLAQGQRVQRQLTARFGRDAASADTVTDMAGIDALRRRFDDAVDPVNGGFGPGPKFPHCPALTFLLAQGGGPALEQTLVAMADGGLRDHVGGGFFRYTVDAAWRVPHFEKMLADNAQLLAIYAEAAVRSGSGRWRDIALETANFIDAELMLPGGGAATSLNAEADGVEGGFYLWDHNSAQAIVGELEWPAFAHAFGLDVAPQVDGHWHLARHAGDAARQDFTDALARLAKARAQRTRPGRDDKRLTGLNALLVTALAHASLWLDAPELGERARAILANLVGTAVEGDQVYACAFDGVPYQQGFLGDYAFLAEAALAVAALGDGAGNVVLARRLADAMWARFHTPGGGLAQTDAAVVPLLYRARAYADDVTPSAASVAVRVLAQLGHVLAEPAYLDHAEAVLRAARHDMEQVPDVHAGLFGALSQWQAPPPLVVLRGGGDLRGWAVEVMQAHPDAQLVWLGADVGEPTLVRYAARAVGAAYVCHGMVCSAPVTRQSELASALGDAAM